jgi:hypothetical protein
MEQVVDFLRYLFAASLTYVFAIAFIKLTILALYWKLFSITARVPIAILFSSVVIWMVVLVRYSPLTVLSSAVNQSGLCRDVFV